MFIHSCALQNQIILGPYSLNLVVSFFIDYIPQILYFLNICLSHLKLKDLTLIFLFCKLHFFGIGIQPYSPIIATNNCWQFH